MGGKRENFRYVAHGVARLRPVSHAAYLSYPIGPELWLVIVLRAAPDRGLPPNRAD